MAFHRESIGNMWSEALARAIRKNVEADQPVEAIDLPAKFIPRKLRATFVTAMREAGADFETLQKYIGHAADSILSAYYDKVSMERLRQVAELGQQLYKGSGVFKNSEKKSAPYCINAAFCLWTY